MLYLKLFLFSVILVGPTVLVAENQLRITQLEGSVAILPEGEKKASPAAQHLRLEPGDQVVTGPNSRVEISSKNGTVIELKEKSSLEIESFREKLQRLFFRAGRFLGSFKKKRNIQYQVSTPVTVASIRGTELALVIDEDEELQAGVVEGEVVFGPPEKSSETAKELWYEDEVLVPESEGLIVKPDSTPVQTTDYPPLVVPDLNWFESVKDRVKEIKIEWKAVDTATLDKIREESLKQAIKWEIPDRYLDTLDPPTPGQPLPDKLDIPKPK